MTSGLASIFVIFMICYVTSIHGQTASSTVEPAVNETDSRRTIDVQLGEANLNLNERKPIDETIILYALKRIFQFFGPIGTFIEPFLTPIVKLKIRLVKSLLPILFGFMGVDAS
ncbi:uncharacterized protein LOC123301022 isoform X1 [Chrysoperla carnea]|uniref:uncharacterized protein LOC123301022 isoform X1 n=1 Tax=Chrysoperla carnea TaxID=189513 RepID=UPI001D0657CC|nr:uncharacterized protein LOC123301022 isoform X1 [Chrysoperla carnea]